MPPNPADDFEREVREVAENIVSMLLEKNRKYGDSALNPKRVFSKASPLEQIKVRLDDKLSRVANQQDDEDEDVFGDIIGYLIIHEIARNRLKQKGD